MNLGRLLEEVYVACGLMALRRVATGGTATTVVDSGLINRKGDGYYAQGANGGHILFISQTTDGLSPQGKFAEVTGFTLSTSTPTFAFATMTDAVGAGDIYAVMKPTIQLYEMIGRINEGLRRITETERVDTTLTGSASTRAYTLPLPLSRQKILKVEVGNNTDGWQDLPGWEIVPATGGTQDALVFASVPPYDTSLAANQTFRITYLYSHPVLSIYSDYVEKAISDDLAVKVCTEAAFELLMRKKPSWYNDKTKMGMWTEIKNAAAQARAEHVIRNLPAARSTRFNLGSLGRH